MNTEHEKDLGRRVKMYREAMDLSQTTLAICVGVSKGFLSQLEQGQTGISIKKFYKLAECLRIKPSLLLNEENYENAGFIVVTEKQFRPFLDGPSEIATLLQSRQSPIDVFEFVLAPGGTTEEHTHSGVLEFVYILFGEDLRIRYSNREPIPITTGGSYYMDSCFPHYIENHANTKARYLVMLYHGMANR